MSYIDETLLPDEHVVYRTSLHWIIFLRPVVVILVGLALLIAFRKVPLVGTPILILGVLLLIAPLVAYWSTEFGVTNKRMIVKAGLIRRRTLELLLRQVEALSVDQSLSGRMLDYGTITLSGTGGVREVFQRVREPLELRRRIQGQVA